MEQLRKFLREVMDKKGLSEWEIEKRAKGRIKDSYIKDILSGKTKSISVEKLNALAEGLGVDGVELYKVASGSCTPVAQDDAWPPGLFAKVVDRLLHDLDFAAVVKMAFALKPARLKALRKEIDTRS
jgi:transcriptional regulator with XRE-family HTH domain